MQSVALDGCLSPRCVPNTASTLYANHLGASMGDLFWNKVAGVVIGGILVVVLIAELGHMLVPSHGAYELTEENISYPVNWEALGAGAGAEAEEVEAGPTDYGLLLANANLSAGERITRRCLSCHTFESGGGNGMGPNLWNVVGSDIAAVAGFGYSNALEGLEGNWTFEALDGFLESPRGYASGTIMSFAGLRNLDDRINLIAYMRSMSDNPVALPAPLAAAEEAAEEIVEEAAATMDVAADAAEDVAEDAAVEEPEE